MKESSFGYGYKNKRCREIDTFLLRSLAERARFGRKSQREVFLPIVDRYTGTTLFVPGEEFLPIKAE